MKGDGNMNMEHPTKKFIDLSSFLCELYNIKFRLENLIIEMEKLTEEDDK